MTCPNCSDVEMTAEDFHSNRTGNIDATQECTYTCPQCGYTETR